MFIQHNASGGEGLSVPTAPTIGNTRGPTQTSNTTFYAYDREKKPMILMMFAMILMMIILMIMMSKMTEKQPNIKRFGKKFTNFSTIAW